MDSQLVSYSWLSAEISTATKHVEFVGTSSGQATIKAKGEMAVEIRGIAIVYGGQAIRRTAQLKGEGWLNVNRSSRMVTKVPALTTLTKLTLTGRTTFLFSDYIKSLLPDYIVSEDSYKDVNGEGFIVRFLKIFGHELNQYYYNKIQELENEWSPLTLTHSSYLDSIAFQLGDIPNFAKDEAAYRRLLTFIISIYKVKGRALSFKAILYPAQVVVNNIVEVNPPVVAYDDPAVVYDSTYFYDQNCATCSEYDLDMTSSLPLTADLSNKIRSLIALVEPINAKLRNFIYNNETVTEVTITVYIDGNGDLIYNNDADPGLILTLTPDGDLEIGGPNANRYYINSSGDLIWIAY